MKRGPRTDLVVNATPLGADGATCAPSPRAAPGVLVVDLLYRPAPDAAAGRLGEAGADAFGGLGLLLHQAALSFELWTGSPGAARRDVGGCRRCRRRAPLERPPARRVDGRSSRPLSRAVLTPSMQHGDGRLLRARAADLRERERGVGRPHPLAGTGWCSAPPRTRTRASPRRRGSSSPCSVSPTGASSSSPTRCGPTSNAGRMAPSPWPRPGTRPGVLVDQMEQMLLVAEEGRARARHACGSRRDRCPVGQTAHVAPSTAATSRPVEVAPFRPAEVRPRAAEGRSRPPTRSPIVAGSRRTPEGRGAARGRGPTSRSLRAIRRGRRAGSGGIDAEEEAQETRRNRVEAGYDEDAEVDRVLLAKEFSGLLQVDSDHDEGSS